MAIKLPFRQIHLDFHTSIAIPDVGAKWNAEAFADQMQAAHVNSVTVFAKCHHGHLYYDTDHPARHPSLPDGLDLLGEQIEALRRRNIQAPIYISILFDEFAAAQHPEWIAIRPDGAPVRSGPYKADWWIMDMAGPYQDYVADQIDEVLRKFAPTDGIFLDICFDVEGHTKWCVDGMHKTGLDPLDPVDVRRFARRTVRGYMTRFKKLVDQAHKGKACKIWFNSRPKELLAEEKKFLHHVEIEALPTGGWGYTFFPMHVRFARTFGLPMVGMTARFHKSWADFGGLKPEAALKYECCQMLAHGAGCSIGDQLHPRGTLDVASYRLIGNVYRHIEACEPWCDGAKPVTEVAVLRDVSGTFGTETRLEKGSAAEGAVRALQQLHQQFDFVPVDRPLRGYRLVIVPETVRINPTLAAKLGAFVADGGGLIVCGEAAIDDEGKPAMKELGIDVHGLSPYQTTYLRMDKSIVVPRTDHVMYERGLRITAKKGADVLARVVEPYFDRDYHHFCSHAQTPTDKLSRYAAAAQRGNVITIAYPIFKAYGTHGNLPYRALIGACIDRLLPQPLIRATTPSHVELTVTRQGTRHVVHMLSYAPQRRTPELDIVEETTPVIDMPIALRLASKPKRVTLQPHNEELDSDYTDGYASIRLTSQRGHEMIVFE